GGGRRHGARPLSAARAPRPLRARRGARPARGAPARAAGARRAGLCRVGGRARSLPLLLPRSRAVEGRMSDDRPVVLGGGGGGDPTGFARVLHGLLGRLHGAYEFHHLGVNYNGQPHDYPWQIYPADTGNDMWGVRRVRELVERLNPRLVFL